MKTSNTVLITICIVILFVVILSSPNGYRNKYGMELYIKTPENEEIKIKECEGLNPEISCGIPTAFATYVCFNNGAYYGKAVSYLNNKVLSSTGWIVLSDFCRQ